MKIVAVRVPEDIKKKMKDIPEDWSRYIRNAIEERIHKEEQKRLLKQLYKITRPFPSPQRGTGAKSIREDRDRG
ncbi:MAG: hypothetical protein AABY79_00030 [Nitrospirota bacterium]